MAVSVIVDANILLYARFDDFPQHAKALAWLVGTLNGLQPVGLPWVSLSAFARIATNSSAMGVPLSTEDAADQIRAWCRRKVVWHPEPGAGFATLFPEMLTAHQCSGNLVTDAYLAALAVEHGATVVSSDTDFARFQQVSWHNPLSSP